MTKTVATCRSDDSLERAAQLMWDRDIGCVLVTDRDGKLVGIVTDRDACMAAYTQGLPLARALVSSAMAHRVSTCGPTSGVRDVEQIMRQQQIRRVPVVDASGRPVGIVTLNDLARAASCASGAIINQREVESTLTAISMPRHLA